MTDEAKALVERLRDYLCDYCGSDNAEAADLIETQGREIERLRMAVREVFEEWALQNSHWYADAIEAGEHLK